ncbi:MAG: type 1 glutamine amidotransferase [Pseudorhodoplanes sp.]
MKFLVFQHHAAESPGVFIDLMRAADIPFDVVCLDDGAPIPELSSYAALLAFGGPANVWEEDRFPWLVAEKAAIRDFVGELRRPFLGICLGHQLLAEAFGGKVGPMQRTEAGLSQVRLTDAGRSDRLFHDLAEPVTAMQWHGAEVKTLPVQGVTLAGNAACPVQAFRLADNAYGLQFHIEVTATSIARWQRLPAYHQVIAENRAEALEQEYSGASEMYLKAFRDTAATLFSRFRQLV